MCSICLTSPCDYRCPNADEISYENYCTKCGKGIDHGDYYLDSRGGVICESCLEDMDIDQILKYCGMQFSEA